MNLRERIEALKAIIDKAELLDQPYAIGVILGCQLVIMEALERIEQTLEKAHERNSSN